MLRKAWTLISMIFLLFVMTLRHGGASFSSRLTNMAVLVGSKAKISCMSKSTDKIHWYHVKDLAAFDPKKINEGGNFTSQEFSNFVAAGQLPGQTLETNSIRSENAGLILCKAAGTECEAQLIVLDSEATCNVTIAPKDKPTHAELYCSVGYSGFWSPTMEWIRTTDGTKMNGHLNITANKVTLTMQIDTNNSDINAQFSCRTFFSNETRPSSGASNIPDYISSCTPTKEKSVNVTQYTLNSTSVHPICIRNSDSGDTEVSSVFSTAFFVMTTVMLAAICVIVLLSYYFVTQKKTIKELRRQINYGTTSLERISLPTNEGLETEEEHPGVIPLSPATSDRHMLAENALLSDEPLSLGASRESCPDISVTGVIHFPEKTLEHATQIQPHAREYENITQGLLDNMLSTPQENPSNIGKHIYSNDYMYLDEHDPVVSSVYASLTEPEADNIIRDSTFTHETGC